MNYRRLGTSGLKLSELSLGAWVTYGGQVGEEVAVKCMSAAHDVGVNFFDNAEAYAHGNGETVMGNAIKRLGWRRESIVVSSKVFWGGDGPTIWSPLASGLLTGKYKNGVPPGSRATLEGYGWLRENLITPENIAKVNQLEPIAKDLGCSMA